MLWTDGNEGATVAVLHVLQSSGWLSPLAPGCLHASGTRARAARTLAQSSCRSSLE